MIITVIVRRDAAQRVLATARVSVAGKDVRCLAAVTWDPGGPLTAEEALAHALVHLGQQLHHHGQQQGTQEPRERARQLGH